MNSLLSSPGYHWASKVWEEEWSACTNYKEVKGSEQKGFNRKRSIISHYYVRFKRLVYKHENSTGKLTLNMKDTKIIKGPTIFFATLEATIDTKFKQKGL